MRQKELKLLATFHTTTDAMAMEKACRDAQIPGKILPLPRSISESCGLCWAVPLTEEKRFRNFVEEKKLSHADYYYMEVF